MSSSREDPFRRNVAVNVKSLNQQAMAALVMTMIFGPRDVFPGAANRPDGRADVRDRDEGKDQVEALRKSEDTQ